MSSPTAAEWPEMLPEPPAEPDIGPFPDSESEAPAPNLPPIVDAASFLAEQLPEPPELVYGILHKGSKMVLGGGSKTFKTWTLTDLAIAVATGEPWLSFKAGKGRVAFLNLEIQPAFFQQRIRAVERAKNITLATGQLDVWNLRGHSAGYRIVIPQIIARIKTLGYALVILDPVYKLYGDTDENAAGAVAQLLNALETLAVETGAAVAFGAHYSKGNQAGKEAIDRISGSGVFARDPDTILNFTRHEEQDAFTVDATLRNFKPVDPFVVRWQYPLMRRCDLDPTKLKQAAGRPKKYSVQSLVECLRDKKLTTKQWLERAGSEIGVPKTQFYELLKEARQMPEVKQTRKGQWFYEPVKEPEAKS